MTAEELERWKRGASRPAPAPLDPRVILFAAVPKRINRFDDDDDGCSGCLFEDARSSVCRVAGEEAKKRGLEDCECGFVYQAVKIDPRQIDLFTEGPP
jgi:hypothetical protein